MVYYFCHRMSLHVCLVDLFLFSIAVWPLVWDRNGPFGILFVVFWLWCRCFKCVLLSLWCLERKQVNICMYYTIFFRF